MSGSLPWAVALVFLHIWSGSVFCLRLISLDIPEMVEMGKSVSMNCSYDLEDDELYSIKWYKNSWEFYRFMPKDRPQYRWFSMPGIKLDMNRSTKGDIFLTDVSFSTSGRYRCEVNGDAPGFATYQKEGDLEVYALPEKSPEIMGSKPSLRIGDVVNVTCKSYPSRPGAELTWYINDEKAQRKHLIPYGIVMNPDHLMFSMLGMNFVVQPSHFQNCMLKLTCVANISHLYSISSEEIITDPEDVINGSIRVPCISGVQPQYGVGEEVNVNCTYLKTNQTVDLQWFINNTEVPSEYLVYPSNTDVKNHQISLGLKFQTEPRHFHDNELRLKCMAPIVEKPGFTTITRETTALRGSTDKRNLLSDIYGMITGGTSSLEAWSLGTIIILILSHFITSLSCSA